MSPMLISGIASAVGLLVGWMIRHNQASAPVAQPSVTPQLANAVAPLLEGLALQLIQQKLGAAAAASLHGVLDQIVMGIVPALSAAAPAPTPAPAK